MTRRQLLCAGAGFGALASAAGVGYAVHEINNFEIGGYPVRFMQGPDGHRYFSVPTFRKEVPEEEARSILRKCLSDPDFVPPTDVATTTLVRKPLGNDVEMVCDEVLAGLYRWRYRLAPPVSQ